MIQRPKITKRQPQSEVELADAIDTMVGMELPADAMPEAAMPQKTERLEPTETSARTRQPMLSDVTREIRLEEKEAGLDTWEEAEDDPGNEVWWFDNA